MNLKKKLGRKVRTKRDFHFKRKKGRDFYAFLGQAEKMLLASPLQKNADAPVKNADAPVKKMRRLQ